MDLADEAGEVIDMLQQQREANIRRQVAAMPAGSPGNCRECGDPNDRLVLGICSPCRDVLDRLAKRKG